VNTSAAIQDRKTTSAPWLALGILLIATFMGQLDVFIVNVAAPSIQGDLHASFSEIELIISGYILAYAVGLVTGGRIGDSQGRRKTFLIGLSAFIVMSFACGVAPDAPLLIVFRIFQGFAAALMLPQVLSIVQVSFPDESRGTALGYYGAAIGLASIAGQLIGGALIRANIAGSGWRAVFFVNIPLGIIALVGTLLTVRESRAEEPKRLDIVGALLLALALVLPLYPMVMSASVGWPVWALLMIVVSAPAFAVFALWEQHFGRQDGDPLLRLDLFRARSFTFGLLTALAFYSGNAGLFIVLAYFFQAGLHLSPLGSGLAFTPLGIGFAAASIASRPLVSRYGSRVLILGAIIMAVSLVLAWAVTRPSPASTQAVALIGPLFLSGVGQGVIAAPLINVVLRGVNPDVAGAASGAMLTATQTANALGVAVAAGVCFTTILGGRPGSAGIPVSSYRDAFGITMLVLAGLAALTAALLVRVRSAAEESAG
jgi:EmrB/QacA subfamily drug resistance transporter